MCIRRDLYMIINEKTADIAKDNAKWKMYSGVGLVIVGPLILFIQNTYGALAMIFVIAGIIVICVGKGELLRIDNFYTFKKYIGDRDEVSLADLAKRVQADVDIVANDLRWMIENGFFENVEIDYRNEIFRSKNHYTWERNTFSTGTRITVESSRDVIHRQKSSYQRTNQEDLYYAEVCECCGGTTKIKIGGGGVCDYCRAPIGKYKR